MTAERQGRFCLALVAAQDRSAQDRGEAGRDAAPGGAGAWGSGGCEHRRSRGADGRVRAARAAATRIPQRPRFRIQRIPESPA